MILIAILPLLDHADRTPPSHEEDYSSYKVPFYPQTGRLAQSASSKSCFFAESKIIKISSEWLWCCKYNTRQGTEYSLKEMAAISFALLSFLLVLTTHHQPNCSHSASSVHACSRVNIHQLAGKHHPCKDWAQFSESLVFGCGLWKIPPYSRVSRAIHLVFQ